MKKNLSSKERNWRWAIGIILIIFGQNCDTFAKLITGQTYKLTWLQLLLDILGILVLLEAIFGYSLLKKKKEKKS